MDGTAIKAMMAEIAPVLREYVGTTLAPIVQRLDALEAREPLKGEPGKDADQVLVLRLVKEEIEKLPVPQDGKDADPEEMRAAVAEEVSRSVEVARSEIETGVAERIAEAVAAIPPAEPGKDADPEMVAALIDEKVTEAVAAIPRPQDGKSVTVDDVKPLVEDVIERAILALPPPVSVRDVVQDRDGCAVFTYSDGTTRNIGRVAGKDGQDADMAALERMLVERVDAIPRPKDGADGLGFDDLAVEPDGDRGFKFVFAKDNRVKEFGFQFPVMVYRGVFKEGTDYARGDTVTWAGSMWHCDEPTKAKPGEGPWTLASKKGRDGKDAKP